MTPVIDGAHEQGTPAWLLTVRGTIHASQSDFSILYPNTCAVLLKMTASPKRALDFNVSASLEFPRTVVSARAKMVNRSMQCEHLFDTVVPDDLPTDHKPIAKWIGARLKVSREFRSRVLPKLTRKGKSKRNDERPDSSDEIWMYVRLLEEETERYLNDKARGKEHDGEATPTNKEHVPEDTAARAEDPSSPAKTEDRSPSKGSWSTASSASFEEPRSTSLD